MSAAPDDKQMRLRHVGSCRLCGATLEARAEAIYERTTKTVRCLICSPNAPKPAEDNSAAEVSEDSQSGPEASKADAGIAGASARREFERRHTRREERIRRKHPKIGGFLLAITDDPQSTAAWDTGALGEERLGQRLNELASETVRVLHDRRIPGTRANIDHLAVTPTGVYVIDAKRYVNKRPSLKVEGRLLRPRTEKLLIGGRDQTKLVESVLKQVVFTGCDELLRSRLEAQSERLGVRIVGGVSAKTVMLISDGTMDGTKAARAREVGTRIEHPETYAVLLSHLQPALTREARSVPKPITAPAPRHSATAAQTANPEAAPLGTTPTGRDPAAVRAWARANGYEVGTRGRLHADLVNAYLAATTPS